jgi:predicted TIM-barrel fold metal-dependent hydrolase
MPISFHVGSGNLAEGLSYKISQLYGIQGMYTKDVTDSCLKNGIQLTDLIMSGVLTRFPGLKFVSVESGIGWIPFVLDCLDYHFKLTDVAKDRPEFTMLPSEYFRRNAFACYWFERTAPRYLLEAVGVENILFETDFPHPTCLFGNIEETIEQGLAGQPEAVRRKILFENAARLYRIDLN